MIINSLTHTPCVREVSEARRPSWKLTAWRLPWFCRIRLEDRARGAPTGPDVPVPNPDAISTERSPTAAAERGGVGLDDDFRQLSDEAPSDGLITIPERK